MSPETGKRYEVELMLGTVDESHIIRTILELSYRKTYVGLTRHGRVNNFILFFPKKKHIGSFVKIVSGQSDWRLRLEEAGIVIFERKNPKKIMLHLKKDEIDQNREVLRELYEAAYQEQFD